MMMALIFATTGDDFDADVFADNTIFHRENISIYCRRCFAALAS